MCFIFLCLQRSSTYSFTGCVKNLQLDGKLLHAAESFGVTPCFEGPTEEGTFFSAEGGYVVLGTYEQERRRVYITFILSITPVRLHSHLARKTSAPLHGSLDSKQLRARQESWLVGWRAKGPGEGELQLLDLVEL